MRSGSLDVMKVVLALMVVGIHTGALIEFGELLNYVFVQGVFRVAVPIFFIINGYYFFSSISAGREKDWLFKVFCLYIFWMSVYSYYWMDMGQGSLFDFAKIFHTTIFGYFHLWYLPATLGSAIIILLIKNLDTVNIFIFLVIAYLIGFFIQYVGNFHLFSFLAIDKLFNMGWTYRNFAFFGFPFFAIGYLIARCDAELKVTYKQCLTMAIIGFLGLSFEACINYSIIGKTENFDILFFLIILSPAIFLCVKKINITGSTSTYALFSSGVYFVHPLIIYALYGYGFNGSLLTLLVVLLAFISSMILIVLNRKFKYVL